MTERNYLKTEAVFLAEKNPKKEVVVTPPLREDSLRVTENGTYRAPIGRGYTDVDVNVREMGDIAPVYVSENGNDNNDGLTAETPVATFAKALEIGNIIYANGLFKEKVEIRNKYNVEIYGGEFDGSTHIAEEEITDEGDGIYSTTWTENDGGINFDEVFVERTISPYVIDVTKEFYNANVYCEDGPLKPVLTENDLRIIANSFWWDYTNEKLYINTPNASAIAIVTHEVGLRIYNSKNIKINNVLIYNVYNEGIIIENSENISVCRSSSGYSSTTGIKTINSHSIQLKDFTVKYCLTGIYADKSDVTINNGNIYECGGGCSIIDRSSAQIIFSSIVSNLKLGNDSYNVSITESGASIYSTSISESYKGVIATYGTAHLSNCEIDHNNKGIYSGVGANCYTFNCVFRQNDTNIIGDVAYIQQNNYNAELTLTSTTTATCEVTNEMIYSIIQMGVGVNISFEFNGLNITIPITQIGYNNNPSNPIYTYGATYLQDDGTFLLLKNAVSSATSDEWIVTPFSLTPLT